MGTSLNGREAGIMRRFGKHRTETEHPPSLHRHCPMLHPSRSDFGPFGSPHQLLVASTAHARRQVAHTIKRVVNDLAFQYGAAPVAVEAHAICQTVADNAVMRHQLSVGYFDIRAVDATARVFDGDVVQLSERLMRTPVDKKAAPAAYCLGLGGEGDRGAGRTQGV